MSDPVVKSIRIEDFFRFRCDRDLPCFNHCCRDFNQDLTPHDVLVLRTYLWGGVSVSRPTNVAPTTMTDETGACL